MGKKYNQKKHYRRKKNFKDNFNLGFHDNKIMGLSTNGILKDSINLNMYYEYKSRKLYSEQYDVKQHTIKQQNIIVNQIKSGILTRMKHKFLKIKSEWVKPPTISY